MKQPEKQLLLLIKGYLRLAVTGSAKAQSKMNSILFSRWAFKCRKSIHWTSRTETPAVFCSFLNFTFNIECKRAQETLQELSYSFKWRSQFWHFAFQSTSPCPAESEWNWQQQQGLHPLAAVGGTPAIFQVHTALLSWLERACRILRKLTRK